MGGGNFIVWKQMPFAYFAEHMSETRVLLVTPLGEAEAVIVALSDDKGAAASLIRATPHAHTACGRLGSKSPAVKNQV
jgi:hypothetical protein